MDHEIINAICGYAKELSEVESEMDSLNDQMVDLQDRQRKIVSDIKRLFVAPAPPPAAKKPPFGQATLGAKVLKFAADKGHFLSSEVRNEYGSSGATYLTILKNHGYVQKLGDGNWKFITQA